MNRVLTANAATEIMSVLRKHQVPLQPSVAMLCKIQGVKLHWVAERCGLHRNSLYKALAGEVSPSPVLVQSVKEVLGINPWQFGE